MNYLVKATPTVRLRTLAAEDREVLLAGEREAAGALIAAGVLGWMWYLPGSTTSVGIWNAESDEELHAHLGTLPFFPYHEVEITPLAAHPAFPEPLRTVGPSARGVDVAS